MRMILKIVAEEFSKGFTLHEIFKKRIIEAFIFKVFEKSFDFCLNFLIIFENEVFQQHIMVI
jgi:hypothetical protein